MFFLGIFAAVAIISIFLTVPIVDICLAVKFVRSTKRRSIWNLGLILIAVGIITGLSMGSEELRFALFLFVLGLPPPIALFLSVRSKDGISHTGGKFVSLFPRRPAGYELKSGLLSLLLAISLVPSFVLLALGFVSVLSVIIGPHDETLFSLLNTQWPLS